MIEINLNQPKMDVKVEGTGKSRIAILRIPINVDNPPITESGKSFQLANFSDVYGDVRFNASVYRTIPKSERGISLKGNKKDGPVIATPAKK